MKGFPDDLLSDHQIQKQKEKLVEEARTLLEAIRKLGKSSKDSLTDPGTLVKAIEIGLIDAPDLRGSQIAKGIVKTSIVDGACVAIDSRTGQPLSEEKRIKRLFDSV